MNPTNGRPPILDGWTITSLMASLLAMATLALVIAWPASWWTWILIAGEAVFVGMMLRHPDHWYRRTATGMLTAAIALAIPPMIRAQADIHGVGKFRLVFDNPPWLSVVLTVLAVPVILLDWLSRRHPRREPEDPMAETSPAEDGQPKAEPSYTGVVEALVDGTVWRARMHAHKVVEVKPFCPRHHVPLKAKGVPAFNWHCSIPDCDYYRFMPTLASFDIKERIAMLKQVHAEIERRVREGAGYKPCADDPASHI